MLEFQKHRFIHQLIKIKIIIHAGENGLVDLFRVGSLGQVSIGAHFHHLRDHLLVIIHCQHDDLKGLVFLPDHADGIDTIYFGHTDIHQYHIGKLQFHFVHQVFPIFGFPEYFQVFFLFEGHANSVSENLVVIGNGDFDLLAWGHVVRFTVV